MLCIYLELRSFADSIPSALTISFSPTACGADLSENEQESSGYDLVESKSPSQSSFGTINNGTEIGLISMHTVVASDFRIAES